LNAAGQKQREFKVDDRAWNLRIANLIGDSAPELITFSGWGRSVKAHNLKGDLLWTYSVDGGVDDVWVGDLNGDGLDEVIMGYKSDIGLYALNNRGQLLWKYTEIEIGNVGHITAGDLNSDGVPEVVTTSSGGKVDVFDPNGKKIKNLDPGCYATVVRLSKASEKDGPAAVLVGGTKDKELVLIKMGFDGVVKWTLSLPSGSRNFINSAQVASSKPWLAVVIGGSVYVVDITAGKIIAQVGDQGDLAQVSWLDAQGDEPLLLVATGDELNAFRIVKK
jgi:hypothetical protein